jgi:hypothetical protein
VFSSIQNAKFFLGAGGGGLGLPGAFGLFLTS